MKKIRDKKEEKFYNDLIKDNEEKWDNRELGNDPKHAIPAIEYKKEGSIATSIRLPISMVADLKKIADEEGIPYQTLVKSVLTKYIRGKKSA